MQSGFVRFYLVFVLATGLLSISATEAQTLAQSQSDEQSELQVPSGYVFGVTVRTAQQLDVVLERADSLRKLFNPDQHSRIAIVLHGNELKLFQKINYLANQSIVDRARLLDQAKIIDIKACQTMMRALDIQQSELPGFIEQVPLGPVEINRLEKDLGFTRF